MRDQEITLPAGSFAPGAVARLHVLPFPLHGCAHAIVIAHPPVEAVPEAIWRSGSNALLTHDPGMAWPDRRGEELARAALKQGGVAALAFSSKGDARRCLRRLARGGSR